MKRVAEIRLPFDHTAEELDAAVAAAGVTTDTPWRIVRQSLDARHESRIVRVYAIAVLEPGDDAPRPRTRRTAPDPRPVVVGAGPGGLFASLWLALHGAPPLLLEQGEAMAGRIGTMARFMRYGVLDERSNLGFGAGGAGAYSDGKLMTRIRSPHIPFILETFVRLGAPDEIRYVADPHVGSSRIRRVIQALIEEIVRLGVEVRFSTRVASLRTSDSRVTGVILEDGAEIPAAAVLLAGGHSARALYHELERLKVAMELKPFAAGLRLEHPAAVIDRIQFGRHAGHPALGAASYRLARTWDEGTEKRAAYTFCMCPGGYVLNAATERGGVVSNGMSNHARRGRFSNAAVVVNVREDDLPGEGLLRGVEWQRVLENAAAAAANPGGGCHAMPAQRLVDFLSERDSTTLPEASCPSPLRPSPLHRLMPAFVVDGIVRGLELFGRRMRGLLCQEALLVGPETRTSAPLRILRDADTRQSPSTSGLYPVGEGAGYAGGITSAAADGIASAEAFLETLPALERCRDR